jgi:GNAT superfamily N-acetyltransferase
MARLEVRPFHEGFVPAAGRLLAQRHRRHRAAMPLLSPRYTDVSEATGQVAEAWKADDASGAVALREGTVVGYLIGQRKSELWGPNVWVESAGHAVIDAEVARDLYAFAAQRWYDEGRTAHYVLVPAQDAALVDAWFRLGFGQQQAHGIQPVPSIAPAPPVHLTIRHAARSDIPVLARLDLALPEHQHRSPVFSAGHVPTPAEAVAEWEEDFDNPAFANFVAEVGGEVVGGANACALELSSSHRGPARPDNAGFLGFAAVLPHARGAGAGRALGEAVIRWCVETGFDSVVTDWRTTNLTASRAWTALGFRPSFLRLHRLLGY